MDNVQITCSSSTRPLLRVNPFQSVNSACPSQPWSKRKTSHSHCNGDDCTVIIRSTAAACPAWVLPFRELWTCCCYCEMPGWRLHGCDPAATRGIPVHRVGNYHETVTRTWTRQPGEGKHDNSVSFLQRLDSFRRYIRTAQVFLLQQYLWSAVDL